MGTIQDNLGSAANHARVAPRATQRGVRHPATGRAVASVAAVSVRIACGPTAETQVVADRRGRRQDFGVIIDEALRSAATAATPTP